MLSPRTLKILASPLAGCALLGIPTYCGPSLPEPLSSKVVMMPLISIYIFHKLGVPGLLEHNGACGCGLCAPTPFGWGHSLRHSGSESRGCLPGRWHA